jgi:hypothetical protein
MHRDLTTEEIGEHNEEDENKSPGTEGVSEEVWKFFVP